MADQGRGVVDSDIDSDIDSEIDSDTDSEIDSEIDSETDSASPPQGVKLWRTQDAGSLSRI